MSGWGRRRKERLLFVSRRTVFQAPEWDVGGVVEHKGTMFVVTRWFDLAPTHNARGGAIPQWEVWGRPAHPDEVGTAMADAAARMLAEAAADRGSPGEDGVPAPGPGPAPGEGPGPVPGEGSTPGGPDTMC